MKKKITQFKWLAATLMLVAAMVMPSTAWAQNTITPSKPQTGNGLSASPYKIGTAAELFWFAALVNGDTSIDGVTAADKAACAELTQNIAVNSGVLKSDGSLADYASGFTAWKPISTDAENPYIGTFDGKGYTISGLYFNDTSKDLIGLFGFVDSGSKICNVGIVDSYFNGRHGIGGVCGYCISGGEITNCYNTGTVIGTGANIGGVCGYSSGTITDCYNTGNVTGTSTSDQEGRIGGVCGCNDGYPNMSTITRSYNSGKVSGGYYVGGMCGANGFGYPAKIINCYNTGEVTGTNDDVGGICGFNGASGSRIETCYNSAAISGDSYVGSVCGFNRAVITTCYYLTTEIALSGVGGSGTNAVSNAYGKNAGQFKSGEVCYLLNASEEVFTWRQNLNSDNLPVLDESHGKVYASAPCPAHFSNSQSNLEATEHSYKDGVCEVCGEVDIRPEMINGVYQLKTSEQLYWFAEQVNGVKNDLDAVLVNDIIVNTGEISESTQDAKVWNPIGKSIAPYTGTFDGRGHTISGLYFNDTSESSGDYVGLFGYVKSGGSISNVGVVNSYFNAHQWIGGICGYNEGSITNCYSQSTVSASSSIGGGICGGNRGSITNCYNTGNVIGPYSAGGICGNNEGSITNCFNTGNVSKFSYTGGVSGYNSDGSLLTNCYYLSGTATGGINGEDVSGSAESKTPDQFKSGEVALLLNGGTTDGSQAWYQNLSAESGDAYPVLTSTGKNTVYGGYQHGETTIHYSNSASDYPHAHAYDSSASDEENGNHDKSYQGVFNWADNDDKTNATVTATFTCAVCGKIVTQETMTVEHDYKYNNTVATCTENGYNYYKTSYSFDGETFPSTYKQTLDALGHNMNAITFNEAQKIYSNQCQREGCGYIGYYATSNGSVEAIKDPEGDGFTASALTLQDATTYDNQAVFTATAFTYNRTFTSTEWTTWYVPFDLTLTADICAKYDFSRINNVHQYDTDNNGTADKTVVESFRQTAGVTLKANYPYLVKPVSESDLNMVLNLEGVIPALAETNSIDCQSVDYKYTFTGTYAGMGDSGSADTDPYTLCDGNKWLHFYSLSPMRHYLTIESRNVSSPSTAPMRSIMLSVVGDEDTTGIVKLYDEERKSSETYDLSGRRLPAGSKPRGLIIENGKVTFKK